VKEPRKDAPARDEKNWLWKTPLGCVESASMGRMSTNFSPPADGMVLYGMPRDSRKQTWYFPTSSTTTLRVYFHTAVSGSGVAPAFGHPKLNGKDAVVALEPAVMDGTVTWYVRPSR